MQIVIPMAGLGTRFRDAGYDLPKPLIDVDGLPMIVRVVNDLPKADRIVFVVNSAHVQEFDIGNLLLQHFADCDIVVTDGLTEGQACSVQLAREHLDLEQDVLVAACDNTHLYDLSAFHRLTKSGGPDALVWTYRNEPRVYAHPNWYGWVAVAGDGEITEISVKQPVSSNLLADHVVSGTFWFRTAACMVANIDRLVADEIRVKNEFYLDSVPNLLLEQGMDVRVFEVEKYIGWGTPADLDDYRLWSRYVKQTLVQQPALTG